VRSSSWLASVILIFASVGGSGIPLASVELRPAAGSSSATESTEATLASTPPMGWNSWDSFGTTVTEDDVKTNASWMAENLKPDA